MNFRNVILLAPVAGLLLTSSLARADFGYTMTRKGGPGGGSGDTKYYYKGQKMKTDSGTTATILDFDAQTITTINNTQKTYTVRKFSDLGEGIAAADNVQADVKETGQHKTINGFNASQMVMTVQMDMQGMKAQMDMEIWVSPDVPGGQELHAFHQRNASKYPYTAMAQGANPGMRAAMANLQKKMAGLNGVPVLEVVHMKMGGEAAAQPGQAAQAAQGAAQSDPRMAAARAQLEQMAKQPGPAGEQAKLALARMGGASSGGGGGGMDITMEAGSFSTGSIPDSVFAIPAGYQKSEK
jgi:hypothetical protein